MTPFELVAHLADKHGFPDRKTGGDSDALRSAHERDHLEGGYHAALHHTHAEASL